jgi:hypothetical protein
VQVQSAVQAAVQLSGPLDVLICNAGSARPGYFHEQGIEVFEQQMRLNYLGVVNTVKAAYDGMVRRGSGHLCLVASTMALMGFVGYSSYAPSKWAVRGLGDCLRNEVGCSGSLRAARCLLAAFPSPPHTHLQPPTGLAPPPPALQLLGSGVAVSVALPPDTETPGYAEESRSKPGECAQISESSSVFTPDQVGGSSPAALAAAGPARPPAPPAGRPA